jgi:hypothetical protein
LRNCAEPAYLRSEHFKPRDSAEDTQPQFWVETKRLPKAIASTFYRKLDETLAQIGFTEGVREIYKPAMPAPHTVAVPASIPPFTSKCS